MVTTDQMCKCKRKRTAQQKSLVGGITVLDKDAVENKIQGRLALEKLKKTWYTKGIAENILL